MRETDFLHLFKLDGNPIITKYTKRPYQICKCCVMDTSDEDIEFDSNGICMRCNEYKQRIEPSWNHGVGHERELEELINEIKKSGENKEYDCIIGLSGGLDSSYMLHLAVKKWGLRPFVLHINAGWDLPVAEQNIQNITKKLGVNLHVENMDWTEMREMQLAWFRTGMESLDVPQDHAFTALIDKYSMQLGIKYILNGYNITTEAIADPKSWSKSGGPTGDGTFVKDVIKKHCDISIEKYEFTNGFKHKFWIPYIKGIKTIKPLNYVSFTKEEMIETLQKEYDYILYGQKHFEDLLTKFLEGFWIPKRFGHDIRRVWLSTLVITGQINRDEALMILQKPPLDEEECKELFAKVARKLEIKDEELIEFLMLPECHMTYRSQEKIYNFGIKLYEKFIKIRKK